MKYIKLIICELCHINKVIYSCLEDNISKTLQHLTNNNCISQILQNFTKHVNIPENTTLPKSQEHYIKHFIHKTIHFTEMVGPRLIVIGQSWPMLAAASYFLFVLCTPVTSVFAQI